MQRANLESVVACLDNLPGSYAPAYVIDLAFVHVCSSAAFLDYALEHNIATPGRALIISV